MPKRLVSHCLRNVAATSWKCVYIVESEEVTEGLSGEGHGSPLQYCCLENPMDRRAWRATVRRAAESGMTERPSDSEGLKST